MKPRVLFVIHGLGVGGAERQLLEYARRAPSSIDVSIIYFLEQCPDLLDAFRQSGLNTLLVSRLSTPLPVFLLRLITEIRRQKPAIVHTFLAGSAATWGRLAAKAAGVPIIVHSDRSLSPSSAVGGVHRALAPLLNMMTTRFVPNANAIAETLMRSGVPQERITVVQNGVDLSRFDPTSTVSLRSSWGVRDGAVVAGFLGRFRPEKRIDLLLDAVLALPEQERPEWLVLGGDGPLMAEVRQRVANNPWLMGHCLLTGLVDDVPRFLASIDYLVLCSDYEGFPNVVLEAMAMRKPVVATRVSDVPMLIDHVGFLAEPGDCGSLKEALRKMQLAGPAERRAMGEKARSRTLSNWDMEKSANAFWKAHLEVMK